MRIMCKLGPRSTTILGTDYDFTLDLKNRAVATVFHAKAIACFLSVEHYREIDEATDEAIEPGAPRPTETAVNLAPIVQEPAVEPAPRAPEGETAATPESEETPADPAEAAAQVGLGAQTPAPETPAASARDPLDHDGDGRKGGSVVRAAPKPTRAVTRRKK